MVLITNEAVNFPVGTAAALWAQNACGRVLTVARQFLGHGMSSSDTPRASPGAYASPASDEGCLAVLTPSVHSLLDTPFA
jgi:hypothetical protein